MRSLICIAAVLTLISAGGGSTRVPPHVRASGLLRLPGTSRAVGIGVGTPHRVPFRVSTTLPRPGAIVEGPLLTFTWHHFPGAAFYYLQLWMARAAPGTATTQDLVSIKAAQVTSSHYALTVQAMPHGIYQWRVVAADAAGSLISEWSLRQSFTLGHNRLRGLTARVLLTPPARFSAVRHATTASFSWQPVVGAAHYYLQIWMAQAGRLRKPVHALLNLAVQVSGMRYNLSTRLMPAGTYQWRVAAATKRGLLSRWTRVTDLTLAAQPLVQSPPGTPTAAPTVASPPKSLAPAYTRYEVGAYYFSGWSHAPNNNLTPLLTGPMHANEPLIGWYDDSQGQVDKTIAQAESAGIDFFAFDWYDIARSPYVTDKTLNEALGFYLTSAHRHRLKFCLNFIDFPPFMPEAADWPALVNGWVTQYFDRPDYERVDGKPLFVVFSPELMRRIFGGSAGVHHALDQLRSRARAAGLPGVTVAVAATVAPFFNPATVQALNADGYDVATGYNYHGGGAEQYGVPVPYKRLVDENVAMWNRVATHVHIPYLPVITSGWDQRFSAREQRTAIIYAGRTPAQLACYAVLARHWIDTHSTQTVREHIVLVFAWNEIGEGGAIIPDHRDGYAYANAVRTVFGSAERPPSTPAHCSPD